MRKRIIEILTLGFCLSLMFTACGGTEQAEEPVVPEKEVEVEVEPEEDIQKPDGPRSLLTNEITDKDLTNRRPLAVMIENTKVCLPHYGLCDAGVVYEAPAEGGITRYLAIFDDYDEFDRLGNVRSARPYYIYFAAEYDGIYTHVGQSTDAEKILNSGIVDELNGLYAGKAFFRSNDRKMPHNAYVSTEGILADLEDKGISMEYTNGYEGHFKFADEENLLTEGAECKELHIYYQNNKPFFIYDEATGLYSKYEFGSLETDAYSDEGLTFSNIILQEASSKVVGKEGQLSINTIGSGNGKFLTRGSIVDITWEKQSEKAITHYYMPDGSEIELNTGKTYIAIIESASKDLNTYGSEQ